MLSYILRRVLLMFPTLIGMTLVVFLIMALAPGGVGARLSMEGALRPQEREAIRRDLEKRFGLNQPLIVQYGRWLNAASPLGFRTGDDGRLRGWPTFKAPDLGTSMISRRPVLDVVLEALPITLLLNVITLPISYGVAILAGIYAARHRGRGFDVASGVVFLGLWSLPTMWVGVMLLGFLASRDFLRLFPTGGLHDTLADSMAFLPHWGSAGFERGWLLDLGWHLVLPVTCLTYGSFAFLSRLMRAAMLENLASDFVRTARAKGVAERAVLFRHVLRNSVLPLITVAAGIVPGLLAGSVIVETIFSINGMGKLMVDAIFLRDRDLVLSETLVAGVLTLISLLVADILYAVVDPRVSYE